MDVDRETPQSKPQSDAPQQDVFSKCRRGEFAGALKLLDSAPSEWHGVSAEGQTLLHWGAIHGDGPFVTSAIQAKVPVDCQTAVGRTPLAWAAFSGRIAAARVLLSAGANPYSRDKDGCTPMLVAVIKKQRLFMLFLMSYGSRDEMLNSASRHDGRGPAHHAASEGDLDTLKLLDYLHVDLAACDNESRTALHCAVQEAQVDVMKFLVEWKMDPLQADAKGRTCMDIACKDGHEHVQCELNQLLQQMGIGRESDATAFKAGQRAGSQNLHSMSISGRFRGRAIDNVWPVTWVICVAASLISYSMQMRDRGQTLIPRFCHFAELLVVIMLALYTYVQCSDPGIVPAPPQGLSGVEAVIDALGAGQTHLAGGPIVFQRLCTSTWVYKGLRTKYCTLTGACVDVFDHRCWWMNCTVGRGNHRSFLLLVFVEAAVQVCWLSICARVVFNRVDLEAYEEVPEWILGICNEIHVTLFLLAAHLLTLGAVVLTLCNQLHLISINLTLNESVNVSRYTHFWEVHDSVRVMKNPFDKGSTLLNWISFLRNDRSSEASSRTCFTRRVSKTCKEV